MHSFFQEFKTFALRGNALDLAVGIVIGAAFGVVTNSLVKDVIMPIIGILVGGIDFSELIIPLGGGAGISYGLFIQSVINFVIIAFALFLVVRFMNNLIRKEERVSPPPPSEEVVILEEIRDLLKEGKR